MVLDRRGIWDIRCEIWDSGTAGSLMFQICDYSRSEFSVYTRLFLPRKIWSEIPSRKKVFVFNSGFFGREVGGQSSWSCNFYRRCQVGCTRSTFLIREFFDANYPGVFFDEKQIFSAHFRVRYTKGVAGFIYLELSFLYSVHFVVLLCPEC